MVFAGNSYAAAIESQTPPSKKIEQPDAPAVLTGKVVQTMNSGGYTYVEIENEGGKLWVAVPGAKLKKGDNVTFLPGAVMENFESKTLKRKFDKIIFSAGIQSQGEVSPEAKHTGNKDIVAKTKEKIQVEKATGENAYTVEELYKNKATLDNKTVIVKGKVVKVSSGIMQKNWVHLQDGTGDQKKGNHNLVTTSTSENIPVVGDVVTMSGTLYKDKDFGAGYRYDIIVENSTYTK
jgi:hypothetical protein